MTYNKLSNYETYIYSQDGWTKIQYHNTDIVSFNSNMITLKTGGWQTATTKKKMNQASIQFELGYTVYQKDFNWYIDFKGQTTKFDSDYVILNR